MSSNTININMGSAKASSGIRYSAEFKRQVVKDLPRFNWNFNQCGMYYKVSCDVIRKWCADLKIEIVKPSNRVKRFINEETKKGIIENWQTFPTRAACARFYKVSKASVYKILEHHKANLPKTDCNLSPETDKKDEVKTFSQRELLKTLIGLLLVEDKITIKTELQNLINSLL